MGDTDWMGESTSATSNTLPSRLTPCRPFCPLDVSATSLWMCLPSPTSRAPTTRAPLPRLLLQPLHFYSYCLRFLIIVTNCGFCPNRILPYFHMLISVCFVLRPLGVHLFGPGINLQPVLLVFFQFTTGFYMAKLDEICYQVCFSSWRDVYETIQNPEFRNPAIGGI